MLSIITGFGRYCLRGSIWQEGQIFKPMFCIARLIDANVEYQIALGNPCAENREQVLERCCDRTLIGIANTNCLDQLIYIDTRPVTRRALGAVLVIKLQAEPDIADESPVAMNHGTEISEARWYQFDSGEVVSLELHLPLSRHCGQVSQFVAVMYQGFEDQETDFSRQAIPSLLLAG